MQKHQNWEGMQQNKSKAAENMRKNPILMRARARPYPCTSVRARSFIHGKHKKKHGKASSKTEGRRGSGRLIIIVRE